MQTIDIKVELLRKGRSMRGLARGLGVSANAVSLVVKHNFISRRIMDAIAAVLDLDVITVFPEIEKKSRGRRKSCPKS